MLLGVLGLAGGYLLCLVFLFVAQRSLLYPAPAPQDVQPLPGTSVLTIAAAPNPVFALWMPPPPGRVVMVDFHGNAGQLAGDVYEAERYAKLDVGYFASEYPGYGLAHAQSPSEEGIYSAAQIGLEYLTGRLGVSKEDVVLIGRSLGTGVAVEMAKRGWGRKLVLVSAFTSIPDVGAIRYGMFPVHALARDRFDSLSKAKDIQIPVLLVHGEEDEVVPFSQGKKLSETFPHATLIPIHDTGHDDVLSGADIRSRIVDFAAGVSR
jgi:pimeloyl-ACP methyl ester carboxylesterase